MLSPLQHIVSALANGSRKHGILPNGLPTAQRLHSLALGQRSATQGRGTTGFSCTLQGYHNRTPAIVAPLQSAEDPLSTVRPRVALRVAPLTLGHVVIRLQRTEPRQPSSSPRYRLRSFVFGKRTEAGLFPHGLELCLLRGGSRAIELQKPKAVSFRPFRIIRMDECPDASDQPPTTLCPMFLQSGQYA